MMASWWIREPIAPPPPTYTLSPGTQLDAGEVITCIYNHANETHS